MKLFTAKEIQLKEEQLRDLALEEKRQARKSLSDSIAELNKVKEIKQRAIDQLEKDLLAVSDKKRQEISELENELSGLLNKRKELLKPIDSIRLDAENRLADAIRKEQELEAREELLAKRAITLAKEYRELQDKKVQVAHQSELLERNILEQNRRMEKIKEEEKQILAKAKDFYEEKAHFEEQKKDEVHVIETEKRVIEKAKKLLDEKADSLKNIQRKINSERAALKAAKKEIYGS